MKRRAFIRNSGLGASLLTLGETSLFFSNSVADPFNMKFSPDFGLFEAAAGKDLLDQIRWAYDQGFRAWESTGLKSRTPAVQESISQLIQSKGMEFGQFVGTMTFTDVTFAGQDTAMRNQVLTDIKMSVEIAKRMNTKIVHNVLGMADPKLPMEFQMGNAIDLLREIVDIYAPHDIMMVMEPMNAKIDHPGMFLRTVPQAYALAKAVNSPHLKILYDVYHVQIEEGNLIPTLDYAWDEIGYIQLGDTPGRNEPTTGEINFKNFLQHLYDKGYRGFAGLEHRNSKTGAEGVLSTVEAYRSIDPS